MSPSHELATVVRLSAEAFMRDSARVAGTTRGLCGRALLVAHASSPFYETLREGGGKALPDNCVGLDIDATEYGLVFPIDKTGLVVAIGDELEHVLVPLTPPGGGLS